MSDDDLYPRWYATLSAWVWGCFIGSFGTVCLYEYHVLPADGAWNNYLPFVVLVPQVIFAAFDIFFRVRWHRELQRRVKV